MIYPQLDHWWENQDDDNQQLIHDDSQLAALMSYAHSDNKVLKACARTLAKNTGLWLRIKKNQMKYLC